MSAHVLTINDNRKLAIVEVQNDCRWKGGYLTIASKLAGELLLCVRTGVIPHKDDANPTYQTKGRKYLHCSKEKARRLIETSHLYGHMSSWQSRNEANDEFSGAVWCDTFAVSFSGLPELVDEALCLVLSLHFNWIDVKRADKIAALSNNPYFKPLLIAWREAGYAVPVPIA